MEPVNPDNLNDPSAPGAGPAAKALPLPGRSLAAPLGPLRVLMVLFIAVPLLAWLAYGAQRFEHLREDSELRLNRTLRIAQEHALKVLQTREINLDQAVAEQGLPGTHFQAFAKELLASEPGMALTMVRSDGAILARWPPMANQPARLSASSPVMRRIAQGQHAGDGQMTSSLDRQERLLSYAKVGHYPAYLVTSMSAGQLKQNWLAEMGQLAAFALPPMLGLLLASRLVLRRTREALHAAEQLSQEMVSRRQVEGALLQPQKMEALGRLTGGVAHDFNNALMVVSYRTWRCSSTAMPRIPSCARSGGPSRARLGSRASCWRFRTASRSCPSR